MTENLDVFMKFDERLIKFRQMHNASQKVFSKIMQVNLSQYQNYEYGKHLPTVDKVSRLCKYFKVSSDFLLGLSDELETITENYSQNICGNRQNML